MLVVDLPSVAVCTLHSNLFQVLIIFPELHLAQLTLGVYMRNTVAEVFFSSFWEELNYQ